MFFCTFAIHFWLIKIYMTTHTKRLDHKHNSKRIKLMKGTISKKKKQPILDRNTCIKPYDPDYTVPILRTFLTKTRKRNVCKRKINESQNITEEKFPNDLESTKNFLGKTCEQCKLQYLVDRTVKNETTFGLCYNCRTCNKNVPEIITLDSDTESSNNTFPSIHQKTNDPLKDKIVDSSDLGVKCIYSSPKIAGKNPSTSVSDKTIIKQQENIKPACASQIKTHESGKSFYDVENNSLNESYEFNHFGFRNFSENCTLETDRGLMIKIISVVSLAPNASHDIATSINSDNNKIMKKKLKNKKNASFNKNNGNITNKTLKSKIKPFQSSIKIIENKRKMKENNSPSSNQSTNVDFATMMFNIKKMIFYNVEYCKIYINNIKSIEKGKLNPNINKELGKYMKDTIDNVLLKNKYDKHTFYDFNVIIDAFECLPADLPINIDNLCDNIKNFILNGNFSFEKFYEVISNYEMNLECKLKNSADQNLKELIKNFKNNIQNCTKLFPHCAILHDYFNIVKKNDISLLDKKERCKHHFCLLLLLKLLKHDWYSIFDYREIEKKDKANGNHDVEELGKNNSMLGIYAFLSIKIELGKLLTYCLIPYLKSKTQHNFIVMMVLEEIFAHKIFLEIKNGVFSVNLENGTYFFDISKLFFAIDLVESKSVNNLNRRFNLRELKYWTKFKTEFQQTSDNFLFFHDTKTHNFSSREKFMRIILAPRRCYTFIYAIKLYYFIFRGDNIENQNFSIDQNVRFKMIVATILYSKQYSQGIRIAEIMEVYNPYFDQDINDKQNLSQNTIVPVYDNFKNLEFAIKDFIDKYDDPEITKKPLPTDIAETILLSTKKIYEKFFKVVSKISLYSTIEKFIEKGI